MRFTLNIVFYVQYRSEEISPRIFWFRVDFVGLRSNWTETQIIKANKKKTTKKFQKSKLNRIDLQIQDSTRIFAQDADGQKLTSY